MNNEHRELWTVRRNVHEPETNQAEKEKCADVETSRFAVLHSSKQFLSSRIALSALGPACYKARFGRVLYCWKTRHIDCL
jgi:hypothetical protein